MRRHKMLTSIFLAGTTLALACGGDDSSGPPPVGAPVVSSVSPTTVSPGDTIVINGSHFSATAGENTVTFRNPLSATKPFAASATRLRVIVDQDATSGPVTVTTAGGSDAGGSVAVARGVGDVFVFGGLGANNVLALPNPTGTTKYLVIPHMTNTVGIDPQTILDYTVQTETTIPVVASKVEASREVRGPHKGPRERFESMRWDNAEEDLQRYGAPHIGVKRTPAMTAAVAPEFQQFYVLKTTTGDQNLASSYARIDAELRYEGTKCLIYADVDTLSNGNFNQSHFNLFGQTYDNSIEATTVSYFGGYSDVDANDRVILLVSPVVNRLDEGSCPTPCTCGFIAGFFNPRDLYTAAQVGSGTTNRAEILYLLAADPTGVWDCEFPVAATASENLGTITHEFEHLISFSYRMLKGYPAQVRWLEEGMAHMAEDLNGDNSSNIGRGKFYREDPGSVSLEGDDTLEQRGGIYLMLRLLADRYGTGILKTIVQSKCTGRACIAGVAGKGFSDVMAEFLAAQYLSGAGITDDPRFNYTSIDINDFGTLLVGARVAGVDVNDATRRSAGDFFVFSGVINEDTRFTFLDTDNGGLRGVFVRIQ